MPRGRRVRRPATQRARGPLVAEGGDGLGEAPPCEHLLAPPAQRLAFRRAHPGHERFGSSGPRRQVRAAPVAPALERAGDRAARETQGHQELFAGLGHGATPAQPRALERGSHPRHQAGVDVTFERGRHPRFCGPRGPRTAAAEAEGEALTLALSRALVEELAPGAPGAQALGVARVDDDRAERRPCRPRLAHVSLPRVHGPPEGLEPRVGHQAEVRTRDGPVAPGARHVDGPQGRAHGAQVRRGHDEFHARLGPRAESAPEAPHAREGLGGVGDRPPIAVDNDGGLPAGEAPALGPVLQGGDGDTL